MALPPDKASLQRWTFLVLFVLAAYLFWLTAEPLWVPIFMGLLIAVGAYPLHRRIVGAKRSPRRAAFSAALVTAGVLLISAAIIAFIAVVVVRQLLDLLRIAQEHYKHGGTYELLGPRFHGLLVSVGIEPGSLQQRLTQGVEQFAGNIAKAGTTVLGVSFGGLLVIIFTALTSYYLLLEGEEITNWFVDTLPLPDGQVWELVRNFRDVTQAMLLGTGVTALYQAVVAFLGYWALGVPSPLVWAALTGVASLLPGIGTTLVWGPVAIWMFATSAVLKGVAMTAWGMLAIIGVADYILRPKVLGNKVRMNDLLVFIAIFGGIEAFGLLGIILGPIFTAVFVALIRIYQREYRPKGVGTKAA